MFEESITEKGKCNQGKKSRKEIGQNTLNMIEAKMKKQEDEKRKKESQNADPGKKGAGGGVFKASKGFSPWGIHHNSDRRK